MDDRREIDSGELWLPATDQNDERRQRATSPILTATAVERPDQRLSAARRQRATALLLLAFPRITDRERLWMSPHLRGLNPAVRVKLVYELERLRGTLLQSAISGRRD